MKKYVGNLSLKIMGLSLVCMANLTGADALPPALAGREKKPAVLKKLVTNGMDHADALGYTAFLRRMKSQGLEDLSEDEKRSFCKLVETKVLQNETTPDDEFVLNVVGEQIRAEEAQREAAIRVELERQRAEEMAGCQQVS